VFHWAVHRALCTGSDRDAIEFSARATPLVRELGDSQMFMHLRGNARLAALVTGDTESASEALRHSSPVASSPSSPPPRGACAASPRSPRPVVTSPAPRGWRAPPAHTATASTTTPDARLYATFLEPARTRCGADAWDAAAREGAAMSFDDAIAYALTDRRTDAHVSTSAPRMPVGHER